LARLLSARAEGNDPLSTGEDPLSPGEDREQSEPPSSSSKLCALDEALADSPAALVMPALRRDNSRALPSLFCISISPDRLLWMECI
jgi:hypothetical protein